MRFYVVDLLASVWQNAPVETENLADAPSIGSLMWVPFPRFIDPTQLDFFIAHAPPFVLRSDAVIVGLHPESAAKVLGVDYILDDVARRIEGSPLLVVHHNDGKPVVEHVRGRKVEGLDSPSTLERIREQDIAEVVRRPGAELPKHSGIHYEGPNGDHYEAFLRPGFAARSIEELDRLAFWLAPMLPKKKSYLVDHSSMISLAYHIGRYSIDLGGSGEIRVESLRAYDEDRDVLARRLKGAFGAVEPDAGAVLVSVNSSGRLVRDVLLPAMADAGFIEPTGVALAGTPNPPEHALPALTILNDDFKRYSSEDCPSCAQNNTTLIPIRHDSYLLDLAAYVQTVAITRAVARPSTEVIERYRGLGAFCVHKTHADNRHHAYFVDLLPILDSKEFRQRLTEAVRPWQGIGIDLIVHPGHEAAAELASLAAKELGVAHVMASDERRLRQLPAAEMKVLTDARRVCFVDDVVISGARLFGYRTSFDAVRRECGATEYTLYGLVGIARTASEKALMGISDVLHHSAVDPRFLSVERLYLPAWDESQCRWCAELRALDGIPDEVKDRPLIRDRLRALRDPDGLGENLFLPWTGGPRKRRASVVTQAEEEPKNRYWELGPNSIFGELQGADLAVSVAAVLQRMRGKRRQVDGTWRESDLDEEFHTPIAKILDPELFVAARYHEPVLLASILRASKRHDIRPPGDASALQERIDILASDEGSKDLHGELMLAALLDQLPRASHDTIREAHPDMAAVVRAFFGSD